MMISNSMASERARLLNERANALRDGILLAVTEAADGRKVEWTEGAHGQARNNLAIDKESVHVAVCEEWSGRLRVIVYSNRKGQRPWQFPEKRGGMNFGHIAKRILAAREHNVDEKMRRAHEKERIAEEAAEVEEMISSTGPHRHFVDASKDGDTWTVRAMGLSREHAREILRLVGQHSRSHSL